jgi:hypothetical protein
MEQTPPEVFKNKELFWNIVLVNPSEASASKAEGGVSVLGRKKIRTQINKRIY